MGRASSYLRIGTPRLHLVERAAAEAAVLDGDNFGIKEVRAGREVFLHEAADRLRGEDGQHRYEDDVRQAFRAAPVAEREGRSDARQRACDGEVRAAERRHG